MLPLFALLSSLSGTAHAQLTHNWLTHTEQALTQSLTHSHTQTLSHEWLLTSGKEQIRRKAKALLLLRLRKHFASFASPLLVSSRVLAATYCCCFVVVVVVVNCSYCCCSRSWSFSLNYFRRTKAHKKENFPKTIRLCVFACDSTRYNNNSNNKKTKRYISSSVRHFDNVFAQILFRVRRVGGTAHKVKIEGPDLARLFSSLLFTSRLFYAEKGHCETKPKTERSITNSSHLGLGLFRLSFVSAAVPSPRLSVFISLSVFRLSCVSFSLYLRLSLCAVFLTCHAYFSPAQQWNRTLRRHFFGLPYVIHHLLRKGRGNLEGKLQPELAVEKCQGTGTVWVPSLTHFGSHR